MLITPADHWFSLCVRTRANWTCEHCGKQYPEGAQGFHCHHYYGRGKYWSVRFEPLNCVAICFFCHNLFHENPDHQREWQEKRLGAVKYEILKEKAYNLTLAKEIKRTKGKGEIASHFKAEYERLLQLRSSGVTGRIEFEGWL